MPQADVTDNDAATLRIGDTGGAASDAEARPDHSRPVTIANDRYVIRKLIAQGGMGEVHLAYDHELQRDVALKTLRADLDDDTLPARFAFEARLSAQLEHPNIVPVHDVGVWPDGRPFYTMRWIRGDSLARVIDDGRMPGAVERLDVFRKICDAIAFAHAQGAIHRDLKPGNVMVGEFGEVLVLDWGIARVAGTASGRASSAGQGVARRADAERLSDEVLETPQTRAGVVVGTPVFMAPELLTGEHLEVDARVDVYALGVMLYKLLTDKLPFSGEHALRDARAGRFIPPRRRRNPVDRELDAIVCKAMARDPAQRYASADELRRDVQAYLEGGDVVAYPRSLLGRIFRWARHNRRIVGPVMTTAGLAAIALLVSGVLYTRALRDSRDHAVASERAAQIQAARAETASALTWTEAARFEEARDALLRARENVGPTGDTSFIDVTDAYLLHEWSPPLLAWKAGGDAGNGTPLEVSPDGRDLMFMTPDHHFRVVTMPEGTEIADHDYSGTEPTASGFVGGRPALALSEANRATVIDLRSGREIVGATGTAPRIVSLLGDGNFIELIDGGVRHRLDVGSGETLPWPLPDDARVETASADGRFLTGHRAPVNRIPDAHYVWDTQTGAVLHTLPEVRQVSVDPSGRWFACVTKDATELRALDTGAVHHSWPGLTPKVITFAHDASELVIDHGDGELSVWSIPQMQRVAQQRFRATLRAVTHDGDLVVSDTKGWSIIARGPPTAGRLQLDGDLKLSASTADGLLVCIASRDGRVRVFEPWTGALLRTFVGAPAPAGSRGCAFSPSVTRLAQADRDGVLRVWSLEDGSKVGEIVGKELVHAAHFLDERRVLASFVGGAIGIWDVDTGAQLTTFEGGPTAAWGLDLSRDGAWVLAAGRSPGDPIATLWRADGGAPALQIPDPIVGYGARLSPDARTMVVGTHPGAVTWWSTSTGARTDARTRSDGPVIAVAFSSDSSLVFSGSELGILDVWRTQDGSEVASVPLFRHGLGEIVALPGTNTLLTLGGIDEVRMFDLDRPRTVAASTPAQRGSGFATAGPGERALQLGRLASMRGDWAAAAAAFARASHDGARPGAIEWARATWAAGDRGLARRLLTSAASSGEVLPGSAAVWASAD